MMSEFLHKKLKNDIREYETNHSIEIPKHITDNLKHTLRPYQEEAIKNLIFYTDISEKYKNIDNKHLLFHMATGSGKTNIIASNILFFYKKRYRNFIFFVNTTSIILKTKDNLIHSQASKYLFQKNIKIDNKNIEVNLIENTFENAKPNAINIMLTTIHKLHGDLVTTIKENSITFDYFADKKVVLIADEAHHLNSELKKKKNKKDELNNDSWGTTSKKLLNSNKDNVLLEFTATAEINAKKEILEHYKDKIIFDYSFKLFSKQKFSKQVYLIQSSFNDKFRIIQAIMISEYRAIIGESQEIDILLKPIVLFKNPKGIEAVKKSRKNFNEIINNLSIQDIDEIFKESNLSSIKELKNTIKSKKDFIKRIKYSFRENTSIEIYSTKDDKNEILAKLNTLEEPRNHIRTIFAVNVLNEGWDVLNLFDIVKLDEAKTTGSSTTSEAQLIGRGARYYPIKYKDKNPYQRKFEQNTPLRMLESVYFHSINTNEYIEKLKTTLSEYGIIGGRKSSKKYTLKLKESFKQHYLYREGAVYVNSRKMIDKTSEITGIDFYKKKYSDKAYKYYGKTSLEAKLLGKKKSFKFKHSEKHPYDLNKLDKDIIISAINKSNFFHFSNLRKYFPNLKSINEFITSKKYLDTITFVYHSQEKIELNNDKKIDMVMDMLELLEKMITANDREYVASKEFKPAYIEKNIKDKEVAEANEKIDYEDKDWYAFKKHYGTSEEKSFVEFIDAHMTELEKQYEDIKLLRNERVFAIFSIKEEKEANRFEPDYILFLKNKKSKCYYQIFIEPKGEQFMGNTADSFKGGKEGWKEELLEEITKIANDESLKVVEKPKYVENACFKIYGLPFFNSTIDNYFLGKFRELLIEK
jgi:type III restriction enzyme